MSIAKKKELLNEGKIQKEGATLPLFVRNE